MKHPVNAFKQALRQGKSQIGLWHGLASPYVADLCAGLGYDWILLDGEHVPNTVQTLLAQLQAVSAHPIAPIVRPSWNDPVQIKLLLDMGAQNLLIPMVQNAEQAKAAVAATRYPPHGIRGWVQPWHVLLAGERLRPCGAGQSGNVCDLSGGNSRGTG